MVQVEKLDNGVQLLLEDMAFTDTVSIGFWILTGSREEKEHEQGYSHFLEHMLFKGTEKRTPFDISRDMDRVGGILNAYTEKEFCCYYCTVPSEHIELALDMLTDMLFKSVFPENEIEKERSVVINEIQSVLDSPDEMAYDYFLEEMWGSHPLAKEITGSIRDVKSITRDKLVAFHRERYIPSNLIISIAGKFDIKKITDSLKLKLENVRQGVFPITRTMPQRTPSWKIRKDRFEQSHLYTGITHPVPSDPRDFYSLLVYSTLFGESISSRLYQTIREEKGLCYTIFSYRSFYSDIFQWTIYASTQGEMTQHLIISIREVLEGLIKKPVTAGEVDDAKSHLRGGLIMSKENAEVRMKRLFKRYLMHESGLEYEDSLKQLDTIVLDDILKIIETYIKGSDFNLFVLANKKCKGIRGTEFGF